MSLRAQAALRSTVIGGQWTQWRLFQHGYTNHGCCLQRMPTLDTLAPEVEEDDRRGQASLAESATCLRLPPVPPEETGEEVQDEVKGTLHHRLWFCPRLEEARTRAVDPDIIEEAR
eukprot:8749544-Pyramimonas_sp.AAC.1